MYCFQTQSISSYVTGHRFCFLKFTDACKKEPEICILPLQPLTQRNSKSTTSSKVPLVFTFSAFYFALLASTLRVRTGLGMSPSSLHRFCDLLKCKCLWKKKGGGGIWGSVRLLNKLCILFKNKVSIRKREWAGGDRGIEGEGRAQTQAPGAHYPCCASPVRSALHCQCPQNQQGSRLS